MAHQQLNGAQIGAGLQQVHREGVTQGMRRDGLGKPERACAALQATRRRRM